VKAVTFSGGGEPLAYGEKRILEAATWAREKGLDAALITNGSLLTESAFLEHLEWLRVSLDGYDPETFARFHGRGGGEFSKVLDRLRAIGQAAQTRKQAGQKCATLGVGFLTDRTSHERGDILRMAEFCAAIPGLDYLQFRPLVGNMVVQPDLEGGYKGFGRSDLDALLADFREAQKFSRPDFAILLSAGKYFALAELGFGKNYNSCFGHFLQATIGADCKVYICCHGQGLEKFCLGDLRLNTFAEIWHSARARQVFNNIDPRINCPPACRLHPQNSILQKIKNKPIHKNFI
jgi:MoaA/NifB/PqqE/SkfB family radical SAM enzyme